MVKVALTSRKGETRSKSVLIGKSAGNCTSNGGLAGVSHTIQPEYARTTKFLDPYHDML
jgi:hypothetical protein